MTGKTICSAQINGRHENKIVPQNCCLKLIVFQTTSKTAFVTGKMFCDKIMNTARAYPSIKSMTTFLLFSQTTTSFY